MAAPPSSIPKRAGAPRRTERGVRIATALAGCILTALAGHAALLRLGESLVFLSYDIPFIVHRAGGADDIRIVYLNELDKNSLDRRPQARLLDRLADAGAETVIYDVIFDQPSADPAVDREFADSIRRFRGVDAGGNPIPGKPSREVFLACGRKTFQTTGVAGEQLVPPIDPLLEAADDFGLVAVDDDAYVIRRLPTGSADEPSLVWKAAHAAGADLDEARRLEPRWINFAGPPPDPRRTDGVPPIQSCSSQSVLSGGAGPWFFHKKIVVVGGEPGIVGEALGKDLFATPFNRLRIGGKSPLMSGVEVQANALANLLGNNWLTRSSPAFESRLIILAGVLAGAALARLRPLMGIVSAFALAAAAAMAGVFSMHFADFWFPWSVIALVQAPVALAWGIASNSYVDRFFRMRLTAEQAAIRAAFAKYLSPQMLERLTGDDFNTDLGGEKIEAAMMFTDLESFTDMCERIGDPQRIVETLNDYFQRTTRHIFEHDGVIIKYIGDAIFAVWGTPVTDPDPANKAVRAAWKLFESDKLVVEGESLKTRIGLHFGEVVAGNIGSDQRVDFTLIGDAVNLAARLEGLNKMFGTQILMSDALHSRLDGSFRTRRVGRFRVKGRREPVVAHELLGPARQEHESDWVTFYHQALDALDRQDPGAALDLFAAADAARGPSGDGASRFFIGRLQSGEPFDSGIFDIREK